MLSVAHTLYHRRQISFWFPFADLSYEEKKKSRAVVSCDDCTFSWCLLFMGGSMLSGWPSENINDTLLDVQFDLSS